LVRLNHCLEFHRGIETEQVARHAMRKQALRDNEEKNVLEMVRVQSAWHVDVGKLGHGPGSERF